MKVTFIGDAHGKMMRLDQLVERSPDHLIIQVGDMGFGFREVPEFPERFFFIRGNHDSPALARAHQNYLGDYGGDEKLFYLSGAVSIDRDLRTSGVSWWPDEELSIDELGKAVDQYKTLKPKVVVSHEAPVAAVERVLRDLIGEYFSAKKDCRESRTSQALQAMLEAHQPELWVFGHYHVDAEFTLDEFPRTRFVCLGELSAKEMEV